MWNADRTKYFGTKVPSPTERVMLDCFCNLHWLKVRTLQNLKRITATVATSQQNLEKQSK